MVWRYVARYIFYGGAHTIHEALQVYSGTPIYILWCGGLRRATFICGKAHTINNNPQVYSGTPPQYILWCGWVWYATFIYGKAHTIQEHTPIVL